MGWLRLVGAASLGCLLVASSASAARPSRCSGGKELSVDQMIAALARDAGNGCGSNRGIARLREADAAKPTAETTPVAVTAPTAIHRKSSAPQFAAPAETANSPTLDLNIEFETGSAELTRDGRELIDKLGQALGSAALVNYHFRIVGHTDTVGSRAFNRSLSERRAAAVAAYITEHFGVSANRLKAVGVGQDDLLVPTGPQTPEVRNRRVEIINTGV